MEDLSNGHEVGVFNREHEEELHVTQPPRFIVEGKEEKVLRLHKVLYDLKKTPQIWYGKIDSYLLQHGFQRSINDAATYVIKKDKYLVIVTLYMDNIIITRNNSYLIQKFKEGMEVEFEMIESVLATQELKI